MSVESTEIWTRQIGNYKFWNVTPYSVVDGNNVEEFSYALKTEAEVSAETLVPI
jgi:hypothetical protein